MAMVFFFFLCLLSVSCFSWENARSWVVPKGIKFGDLKRLTLSPQKESDNSTTPLVSVATRAVGLNFADVFALLGFYRAANLVRDKKQLNSFCPGLEFAGRVVMHDAAAAATDFAQHDRVFGFVRFGAYADVVQTKPVYLRKLPHDWTYEQGASFLVNVLTAWHGLVTMGGLPRNAKNKVVLVHAATGGVGLWACEIAARRGATVIGVVGHQDKIPVFQQRIQPLCPQAQCIVRPSDTKRFGLAIQQVTDGVDYVMECYGGSYFVDSFRLVRPGGTLVTYGSTTYNGGGGGTRLAFLPLLWKYLRRPRIDPGELTTRNVRVAGFNLVFLTENASELAKALDNCIDCLSGGGDLSAVTPPVVGNVFGFDTQAVEALQKLRSGTTVGKVVLTNPNNPILQQE